MKHKETLMEKMIKRFYGISGVLDEYRLQEIRRIGNNAFMFLFWYLLLSNFIVIHLIDRLDPEIILLGFCTINILVLVFVVCGYVTYQVFKLKLAKIEASDSQRKSLKRKSVLNCALSGIFFATIGTVMSAFDSKGSFMAELLSPYSLFSFLFGAIFFGGAMYLLVRYQLKNEREEE